MFNLITVQYTNITFKQRKVSALSAKFKINKLGWLTLWGGQVGWFG